MTRAQVKKFDELANNVDPKAKLPRGFALWSAPMQIAWMKSHQKRDKLQLKESVPLKVKANKELWEEWTEISRRIDALKAVVQNDTTITAAEVEAWEKVAIDLKRWMDHTISDTTKWLLAGGRK